MVRKRSRKHYESDDNDTDSDFNPNSPPRVAGPKKYSLRQRKRAIFTEDFDYDDDDDIQIPAKSRSDDDDFQVESDSKIGTGDYQVELDVEEAENTEYINSSTFINTYEPQSDRFPENSDGLIDFEDIIRADIVVNKNRIDYDNIIQKTEIKVHQHQLQAKASEAPPPRRRGRKPKVKEIAQLRHEYDDGNYENGKEMMQNDDIDIHAAIVEKLNPNSPPPLFEHTEALQTMPASNEVEETAPIVQKTEASETVTTEESLEPSETDKGEAPVIEALVKTEDSLNQMDDVIILEDNEKDKVIVLDD